MSEDKRIGDAIRILASESIVVSTTACASIIYNDASSRFAEEAVTLDNVDAISGLDSKAYGDRLSALTHASLASVVIAHFAVEAFANELYLDWDLFGHPHYFRGIPDAVSRQLSAEWRAGAKFLSLREKFEKALVIAEKPEIKFGGGIPQQLVYLDLLRDELVHHKPLQVEISAAARPPIDPLERQLMYSFRRTNIAKAGTPYRWAGCLGSGCAQWAVNTSRGFQQLFRSAVGATATS